MGRKAHIPLEIDFIMGLDQHDFTELTLSERMTFIYIWSDVWHSGRDQLTTKKRCQMVLKRVFASTKHLNKWLTTMQTKGLIEIDGESVKLLGLNRKRQAAFRGKGHQKGDENEPTKQPNRNINKGVNEKGSESEPNSPINDFANANVQTLYRKFRTHSQMGNDQKVKETIRCWIVKEKLDPMAISVWIEKANSLSYIEHVHPDFGKRPEIQEKSIYG